VIGTVHDLAPFHLSEKYGPARNFYQMHVMTMLQRRLTHIIAISESTKRDIQKFVGIPDERITVIHHAADTSAFYPRCQIAAIESVRSYGIRPPYIVYASRIESPAKNHIRLINAFEKLKKDEELPHQLVLAGADWHGAEEVHKAAVASSYSSDILLTGYVADTDLPNLYCGAEMMAFPSLFEGFGLPILEAMSCGVPVACSNISSMPEIAGEAAALFDPLDVDSIAEALLSVLSSEERSKTLSLEGIKRAGQFSWHRTASKTLEVIHKVFDQTAI
jgi:glycosyltransferase involved in cell wall biosynthesis